jgi:hypothetical protein
MNDHNQGCLCTFFHLENTPDISSLLIIGANLRCEIFVSCMFCTYTFSFHNFPFTISSFDNKSLEFQHSQNVHFFLFLNNIFCHESNKRFIIILTDYIFPLLFFVYINISGQFFEKKIIFSPVFCINSS